MLYVESNLKKKLVKEYEYEVSEDLMKRLVHLSKIY